MAAPAASATGPGRASSPLLRAGRRAAQAAQRIPILRARVQTESLLVLLGSSPPPACRAASAYQAGRSRVCLNIPHSIYNSRNKLKPHRLCACHVQCPSHFFPHAALIQPLKSTWGIIFRVIWGYFPTSSRGEIPGSFLFTQCCSRCRFPSLSAALRRQKWSCKAEKPGEKCLLVESPQEGWGRPRAGLNFGSN